MSYDFDMVIDTGGEYPATVEDVGSCTYNVAGMFCLALDNEQGIRALDGKTGRELIPILERAVSHIRHPDNAAAYREMNPANGWGSHEGAAETLERILAACRKHPKAKLSVC